MLECHANVFAIRPGRVLGIKLQHFTPAHLYLLEAIRSPFLFGTDPTISQLLLAVLICSVPAKRVRKLSRLPRYWPWLCFWWGLWVAIRRYDISAAMEGMSRYLCAYMDGPRALRKKGATVTESAFPMALRIVWTLMQRMPEAEAWCKPMPLALAYTERQAECDGVEFVTERIDNMPLVAAQG